MASKNNAVEYNPNLIVALDFNNLADMRSLVETLDPSLCRVKVGKEMFTRFGSEVVKLLHELEFDVFLDLKFHDIPATVAKAVKAAADLGVWMVNVHASGGAKMMEAAAQELNSYDQRPLLIGVTVLTSMSDQDFSGLGYNCSIQEQVLRLAMLAKNSGLDGVVCSAMEAKSLSDEMGPEFLLVTPGIRPEGSKANDQTRIMTPRMALDNGSHYLVVGRPITQAENPQLACEKILDEMC